MKLTLFFGLLVSIGLIACGPEPTTHNRKVTRYIESAAKSIAPGGTVYCTVAGTDCWEWVGSGDVVYFRGNEIYSNFLQDYQNSDLTHFFQTNEWRYLFPDGCPVGDDEISKVASGQYATKVMADSSIVIFDNNISLGMDQILFVVKR